MNLKRWFLASLVAMSVHSTANAYETLMFNFGTGYREDGMKFTTTDDSGVPVIRQEKKWRDMKILPAMISLSYVSNCKIYARGYATYGRVYDGTGFDRLFEDDVINDASSFRGCADRGEVFDFNGGLGYQLRSCDRRFSISPLIGYAHNEQHFRLYRMHTLADPDTVLDETHQSFMPLWRGPWLGVDASIGPICKFRAYGGWEFHWLLYRATGSETGPAGADRFFRHKANGYGQFIWGGVNYECCKNWSFGLQGTYQWMWTKEGSEFSKQKNLNPVVEERLTLNRVDWHSFTGIITVVYNYP